MLIGNHTAEAVSVACLGGVYSKSRSICTGEGTGSEGIISCVAELPLIGQAIAGCRDGECGLRAVLDLCRDRLGGNLQRSCRLGKMSLLIQGGTGEVLGKDCGGSSVRGVEGSGKNKRFIIAHLCRGLNSCHFVAPIKHGITGCLRQVKTA